MRIFALIAAFAALVPVMPADAQGRGRARPERDQDAAYHAMQQGEILPLPVILSRVRVRGAQFIGADLDPSGQLYRLTFMRGTDVIRVIVDARTGRAISISR